MNKTLMMVFVGLGVIMMLGLGIAAVNFFTSSVDVTINEALSSTSTPVSVSGFPGEVVTATFTVDNAASVPLDVDLAWAEVTNVNGVTYSHDMPKTVTMVPGSNTVTVSYTIDTGSPVGTFDGTVSFTRT